LSVVGYRDLCDKEKEFSIFPFCESVERCVDFLSKLGAFGGGDTPEDICGAFHEALT